MKLIEYLMNGVYHLLKENEIVEKKENVQVACAIVQTTRGE